MNLERGCLLLINDSQYGSALICVENKKIEEEKLDYKIKL